MAYRQEGNAYPAYSYASPTLGPPDLSGMGSGMEIDFDPPRPEQSDTFPSILGTGPPFARPIDNEPWSVPGFHARSGHLSTQTYPFSYGYGHAHTDLPVGALSPRISINTQESDDVSTNFNGLSQPGGLARHATRTGRRSSSIKSSKSVPDKVKKQSTKNCPFCSAKLKMNSEFKKHLLRHEKPFKCEQPGCPRGEGFTTSNDLQRHLNTVHKVFSGDRAPKVYRCASTACQGKGKQWTRLDNFRQHVSRTHPTEDPRDLIKRSEAYADAQAIDVSQSNTDIHTDAQQAIVAPDMSGPTLQIPQSSTPQPWQNVADPYFTQSPRSIAGHEQAMDYTGRSVHSDTASVQSSPVDRYKGPVNRARTSQSQHVTSPIYSAGSQSNNSSEVLRSTSPPTDVSQAGRHLNSKPTTPQQLQTTFQHMELRSTIPDSHVEHYATKLASLYSASPDKSSLHSSIALLLSQFKDEFQSGPRSTSNGFQMHGGLLSPTQVPKRSRSQSDGSQPRSAGPVDPSLCDYKPEEKEKTTEKTSKSLSHRESNSNGTFYCKEAGCDRNFLTNAALKKHMRRHDRPFGCTFDSCYKKFGSKNDWKRHENSQHFQVDVWRCDEPRPSAMGDAKCGKIYYRREIFAKHLEQVHHITDHTELSTNVKNRRVGQLGRTTFWCGFCRKMQKLNSRGLRAWDERFNHIGEHFTKQNKHIDEWQSFSTRKTKAAMLQHERRGFKPAELEPESDIDEPEHRPSSPSKSPPDSTTLEHDEVPVDVDSNNSDADGDPDSDNQTPATTAEMEDVFTNATREQPQAPNFSTKQPTKTRSYETPVMTHILYFCCDCGTGPQNSAINSLCQDCSHRLDSSCCSGMYIDKD